MIAWECSGSMTGIVAKFLHHVIPGVARPLRILWNEVMGFLFLVIAAFVSISIYRRAKNFTGDPGGLAILVVSCLFALLLAWYGVSAFWRARKISRS